MEYSASPGGIAASFVNGTVDGIASWITNRDVYTIAGRTVHGSILSSVVRVKLKLQVGYVVWHGGFVEEASGIDIFATQLTIK